MESTQPPNPQMDDDALVTDLRRVLAAVDPVPEHVRLAARLAIEWRTLDAELAALVYDSTVDEPVLALRGDAGPRALTFEAERLTIEIEAEADGGSADALRIVGQLVPPQAAQIAIHSGDALIATRADEHGRFDAAGLRHGELRLRCRLAGDQLVETTTLTL